MEMIWTEAAFEEAVQRAAAYLPAVHVTHAIDHYRDNGHTHRRDIPACVQLAAMLAEVAAAGRRETAVGEKELPELQETPTIEETGRAWVAAYTPEVESLRQDIFGNARPPFPGDLVAAGNWIEEAYNEQQQALANRRRQLDLAISAAKARQDVASAVVLEIISGIQREFAERPRRVVYPAFPEASGRRVCGYTSVTARPTPADPGADRLWRLSRLYERIARATSFFEEDITIWILCAIEPSARRAKLAVDEVSDQLLDGRKVQTPRIIATFYLPDLTFRELRGLHRDIRELWLALRKSGPGDDGRRPARLTELDRELLQAVEGIGGLSEHPTADEWEQVRDWYRQRGQSPRTSEALRKHHKRLAEKLRRIALPSRPGDED